LSPKHFYDNSTTTRRLLEQAVGGRPPQYAPSPPSVGPEAHRATEPTEPADGNVAVDSNAQYVPTLTAAAG